MCEGCKVIFAHGSNEKKSSVYANFPGFWAAHQHVPDMCFPKKVVE